MARLLAIVLAFGSLAAACGTDAAEPSETPDPAGVEAGSSFCDANTTFNAGLDDITRTMMATMNGEPLAELITALTDTAAAMQQAATLAPADLTADAELLAEAYVGFGDLLAEVEYDVAGIPVDDPRAVALTTDEFTEAIIAVNLHCGAGPKADS